MCLKLKFIVRKVAALNTISTNAAKKAACKKDGS